MTKCNLINVNNFLDEIDYLKNRSMLLDKILEYWDQDKMTFDIPVKHKLVKMTDDLKKKLPKSPRHQMNEYINSHLPTNESCEFVNHDKLYETYL